MTGKKEMRNERHAIIGVALVLFLAITAFTIISDSTLTGLFTAESTVTESHDVNATFTNETMGVITLPTSLPVRSVMVTGTAEGIGTVKVLVTDGDRNWTVYEERLEGIRGTPTGFVILGEGNASAENLTDASVNASVDVPSEDDADENVTIDVIAASDNVSVNASINTTKNTTQTSLGTFPRILQEMPP